MILSPYVLPAVALVAGVLILVRPQYMYVIVGVYLILIGIFGIVHH